LTEEDKRKSKSYLQEKERKKDMQKSSSIEDYLKSLSMKMTVFHNKDEHIPRVSQLTQKTNQFNLTTKRYSIPDVERFMKNGSVFSFSVEDKFGDMGIVGVIIISDNIIDTLLLSCRAFGRNIEKAMLSEAMSYIDKYPIFSEYIQSKKNSMTETFYEDCGFQINDEIEANDGTKKKIYSSEKDVKYADNFFGKITWN